MASHLANVAVIALLLFSTARAGVQVILPVFNLSPFSVRADFSGDGKCIKTGVYDTDDIRRYYRSYAAANLTTAYGMDHPKAANQFNTVLQDFKSGVGVSDLSMSVASMAGQTQLGPYDVSAGSVPFASFQAEVDSGVWSLCKFADSWKRFTLMVEDHPYDLKIEDPSTAEWELSMHDRWNATANRDITIGEGSTTFEAVLIALSPTLPEFWTTCAQGLYCKPANQTTPGSGTVGQPASLDFDSVYKNIPVADRLVCLMGKSVAGILDCLVTGVAIVIQVDGRPVAVPMPAVGNNWA